MSEYEELRKTYDLSQEELQAVINLFKSLAGYQHNIKKKMEEALILKRKNVLNLLKRMGMR